MIADRVTARGAFRLPYASGLVPEKSKTAVPCMEKKANANKFSTEAKLCYFLLVSRQNAA